MSLCALWIACFSFGVFFTGLLWLLAIVWEFYAEARAAYKARWKGHV
jgi:hypothetical protein